MERFIVMDIVWIWISISRGSECTVWDLRQGGGRDGDEGTGL